LNFRLERILESKGIKNVMWSLLSYDYKNDLNIVKFALRKYLKKDSIIVFHDSNKSKNIIRHAVEFAVHTVQRKGFEFGEPGKCLK
jgi:peptidoglycan/xylan/chitin deacetylase (PgdA/CDA1 family)